MSSVEGLSDLLARHLVCLALYKTETMDLEGQSGLDDLMPTERSPPNMIKNLAPRARCRTPEGNATQHAAKTWQMGRLVTHLPLSNPGAKGELQDTRRQSDPTRGQDSADGLQ
jgi:hypothetical protein